MSSKFTLNVVYEYFNFAIFRSDQMLLGCCGFHGDVLTVTKNVETQMKVHVKDQRFCMCTCTCMDGWLTSFIAFLLDL